jgi:GNAT superfamily N-acetyltransferase
MFDVPPRVGRHHIDGFLAEDRETIEIGGLWVSPKRRRTGIGSELLSAIVVWAQERGGSSAGLWVRTPTRALESSTSATAST